ncbi:MAG TPA: type VI secretion system contractile sheath small subunit [Gammaproteobacteria bacterium]
MADQKGSVAPKERVNIVYKSTIGDQSEDVELPLKLLMIGDYTGKPSDAVVEEREPVNVNKDNLNDVMKSFGLSIDVAVPDRLSDEPGQEIAATIKFESMKDFSPDSVARQVPELKKLLELRQALQALKGPLGNVPAFRKGIQEILKDEDTRKEIMRELGLGDGKE